MRWLSKQIRDERGATAVMVGILMIPLLGFAAISVDVGALYFERAQLQNGADAAALAIALECAEDDKCTTPNLPATNLLATNFANGNANDGVSNVVSPVINLTAKEVLVTTSTKEVGGASFLSHPFARFIGIETSTVRASATAKWGAVSAGTVLPLAISLCDLNENKGSKSSPALIRYDQNKTCKVTPNAAPIPGGFGWLDRGGKASCLVEVSANSTVLSEAGNSYPSACDSTMTSIAAASTASSCGTDGKIVLVPIHNGANPATGRNKAFQLHGLAAFCMTGWNFSGNNSMPRAKNDSAAPRCEGNCRGIQGYFVKWNCVSEPGQTCRIGAAPNLGATAVRLIK